ncbi:MAG: metalloregulator ArsR/SmtB family transcription factor [Pseudomonadota bacterium]
MDDVFKALADNSRRTLLDRLREQDGQSLSELERVLGMTRFGVMKHLKVLEAAGLVVSRKVGRFKYHYLNAAPLQQVIDRWIEPLIQKPLARAVLDLKAGLEGTATMTTTNDKPDFVLQTYIRTTTAKLWDALTSAEITPHYNIQNAAFHGKLEKGERYEQRRPDGSVMLSGEILDAIPGERLEMTFIPGWEGDNPHISRCVYEIEVTGDVCKLTILHFDLPADATGIHDGWSSIVASLKSLLETGRALTFANAG